MTTADAPLLVTGANGFVGARVCARLVAAGHPVRALVRRPGTAPAGTAEVLGSPTEADAVAAAAAGVGGVVHVAATAGADLDTARAVNVGGTRTVLDTAAAAGLRVVHVSTTSVVDPEAEVVDDDAPLVGDGGSAYAVTKREAEEECAADVAAGRPVVVLRPPCVLGWGPTSTWGQRVPEMVADGGFPFEAGRGDGMGWVHVDDYADAVLLAVRGADEVDGAVLTVAGGTATWADYVDTVRGWFPGVADPLVDREPDGRRWDASGAARVLGWRPSRSFADGMAEARPHHTA